MFFNFYDWDNTSPEQLLSRAWTLPTKTIRWMCISMKKYLWNHSENKQNAFPQVEAAFPAFQMKLFDYLDWLQL